MADTPTRLDVAQLVADHSVVLYRYAYRLTGTQADAEDLTQQTFLQAHTHLDQLREPAAVRGWLFSILRHAWQKMCRQQSRIPESPSVDVENIVDHSAAEIPIDEERLQAALGELPAEFRSVLLMYYFEELSYKEIADGLEVPIGTIMSRLSRAKQHLKRRLSQAVAADDAAAVNEPVGSGRLTR